VVSLEIKQREREGIAIFDLKGRIVMGPEASEFREAILPVAGVNGNRLILNMAEVAYVDSTGLGALVFCASAARKSASTICLLDTNARNLELLVTTKLELIFQNFTDEQDAVNSFFPDRVVQKFDILDFVRGQQDAEDNRKPE
jgi:anti-sigma B factor antagonist